MFCIDIHAVGETDTRDALEGFQTVVDVVSILVEGRSLPPRRVVRHVGRNRLFGNIR